MEFLFRVILGNDRNNIPRDKFFPVCGQNGKSTKEEILRKYGIIQEIIEILIWDTLGNSRKNIPNGKLFSPPVDKMGNLLMRIFEKIWDYSGKH